MRELISKYKHIPAMTPTVVHDYLRECGRNWTGQGTAIELGSWLGGTAVPLLEGLVESGYNRPFYCFDRWLANPDQAMKARMQGLMIKDKQNLLPIFLNNITPVYKNIITHVGNISETIKRYPKIPIEICLFDAPKTEPTFSNAMREVLPYFIEGVTILGLLDYSFYKQKEGDLREKLIAPVVFITRHEENFVKLAEWPTECSCVFFKYVKKI